MACGLGKVRTLALNRNNLRGARDPRLNPAVYPHAGHAFNTDYRASHVAADAKDGYARCLA